MFWSLYLFGVVIAFMVFFAELNPRIEARRQDLIEGVLRERLDAPLEKKLRKVVEARETDPAKIEKVLVRCLNWVITLSIPFFSLVIALAWPLAALAYFMNRARHF